MKKKQKLHLGKIKIASIHTIAFKIKGGDTANCNTATCTSDTVITHTNAEGCYPTYDYDTCTESAAGSCTQNTRAETNHTCGLNPTRPDL